MRSEFTQEHQHSCKWRKSSPLRRCPPGSNCGHSGLEENLLKSISADVLGIDEFDEAAFTDKVDRITVVSNEELIFHLLKTVARLNGSGSLNADNQHGQKNESNAKARK